MLKLGFKKDESVLVQVGDQVCKIIIGGYEKGSYRLIFDAPKTITVVRLNALKTKEGQDEEQKIRLCKI